MQEMTSTRCRICLVRLSQRSSYVYGGGNGAVAQLWKNSIISHQNRALKNKVEKGASSAGSSSGSTGGAGRPPQANMEVCQGANIYKTGTDPPIKEDSTYPDWLWGVAEPPISHMHLSPDTKSYWRRLNKTKARERNLLKKQSAGR